MLSRTETIHLRRGSQSLSIAPEIEDGLVRYVGSIDGSRCVTSITREGAVSALLRRAVHSAANAGYLA